MVSTKATTVGLDRVIGQRIKTARMEVEKSQNDLGVAIGVSFQQVQKYEKGTNRVSTSTLHEIAKVLQKPISYFIDDGQFRPNERGMQMAAFMATRQGQALVSTAMLLSVPLQQTLISVAEALLTTVPTIKKRKKEHA